MTENKRDQDRGLVEAVREDVQEYSVQLVAQTTDFLNYQSNAFLLGRQFSPTHTGRQRECNVARENTR
jgi:hypothetical protein